MREQTQGRSVRVQQRKRRECEGEGATEGVSVTVMGGICALEGVREQTGRECEREGARERTQNVRVRV